MNPAAPVTATTPPFGTAVMARASHPRVSQPGQRSVVGSSVTVTPWAARKAGASSVTWTASIRTPREGEHADEAVEARSRAAR